MPPTFLLLGLSICAVWTPLRFKNKPLPVWPFLFAGALGCALASGFITPVAIAELCVFAACAYIGGGATATRWRNGASLLAGLAALALAMHRLPGFNNPISIAHAVFAPDAAPYTQYLNLDKAAAGLMVLAFLCRRCGSGAEWRAMLSQAIPIAAASSTMVLVVASLIAYVRPEFKWPSYTPIFLATNLLFTCVAEEAFFRGLLQEKLAQALARYRHGGAATVAVSAILFGLVHAGGGPKLVLLATLGGVGAAYAYARTRRIEAAIITHFTLNAVHFVFFTYPFIR